MSIAGAIAVGLSAGRTRADTLCTKGETVTFSCRVGKKLVSVCALGSGTKTILQYRFGKKNAVELRLPNPMSVASQSAVGGTLMYSGGGGAWLKFRNGDTTYTVYTGIGRGWNKEGVAVEKKGKLVANLLCPDLAESRLSADEFSTLGILDDQSFEIP